jgi:DNA-binding transcriptional LysR family regulator
VSEWSDLKYFLCVAKTGTLAGAARAMNVEATTVGRRLVALEQSLGARLFDRTPDGFVLTLAGERIVDHARRVEAEVQELERKAAGEDARLEGTVRLATSENLAVGFLSRLLAPLHERHPHIVLEMAMGSKPADLLKHEADLAVRVGPNMRPQQQTLVARKLCTLGMGVYAAESYVARHGEPRLDDRLEGHLIVTYGDELAAIPQAKWIEENGANGRVVLRSNSMLAVAKSIEAGVGVGMLPCFLGDNLVATRRLNAAPLCPTDAWLVVHPDLARTARVRAVIDFLVDAVTALQPTLRGDVVGR